MDELARKAGKDPIAFRRGMLATNAAAESRARSGCGKIRLGEAAAGAGRARRVRAAVVRELHRHRRRSGSRRSRRGASAPRHLGGRHRHRRQSRHHRRAIAGRADLRPDRRALRRDHHREGPRAAIQLQRLPHAAHRRGAERSRCMSSRAARSRAASAKPAARRARRRCATRSMPRPASRCAGCRSTATRWRSGTRRKRHAQTSAAHSLRCRGRRASLRSASSSGASSIPDRWRLPAGRRWRSRTITPPIRPAFLPSWRMPIVVKRGEYLARAADCMVCHTAPRRRGNMPAGLRFRCRSARSIRPTSRPTRRPASATTAIADFLNAVQRGIRRDGTHLYPAMPYPSYTYMTDADALAIKAYLFSLAPVHAANRADTLAFPFNQRWAMGFWSLLFKPECPLRAQHGAEPASGTEAPISPKRWRIAANATRRAISLSRSTTGKNSPAR